jgi:signal recognition particle receptor subunit beta
MVLINHAAKEMTAKLVYYGPGLCGKTTNLIKIFEALPDAQKGKMLSLATKQDRTLFFDLLPVEVGKVKGLTLRFQLYTVPGQVFYNETRKLVLKNTDAEVFVADSQEALMESNRESFANLIENLKFNNLDPKTIPILIQYNKRDIPGVPAVEKIRKTLGLEAYPHTEAAALQGEGVMETFAAMTKLIIRKLKGKSPEEALPPELKKVARKILEDTDPGIPKDDPPPFPEVAAKSYDKVEEISLEKLLDERKRSTTIMTAPPPKPVFAQAEEEEVEELPLDALVEEPPSAAAMEDTVIHQEEPLEVQVEPETGVDLDSLRAEVLKIRDLVDGLLKKLQ